MKKLLLLLFASVLCGCSCLMSQVPPQTIYVDESCQGAIPDFTLIVVVRDNCPGVTLTQSPVAGSVLDVNNPLEDVIVRAVDAFGNISTLTIPVLLVDTIPPVLEWPEGQIAMSNEEVMDIYVMWKEAVKVHGIAAWMADLTWTNGMQFADTTVYDNLRYFNHVFQITDEELERYVDLMEY